MPKQVKSHRLSALTVTQLAELAERWGTSQTETVSIAIDRIYQQERMMNTKTRHTFTRQEIVDAATAALDNWDFDVEPEYGEQMRQSLQNIVDGSDDVGTDADYPAEWSGHPDRETALIDWLDEYSRTH